MQRVLFCLAVLLAASGARGQTGPVAFADRAGGPESDTASGVVADDQGNVYVVGTIDGTATFGSISVTVDETGCVFSTCHDAFVAKYAPDGTALWVRSMGTPVHNDVATAVASYGGDVLVSGYFTGVATWDGGSNPDISLTTRSDFDAFLARYTASGDLLWVVQGGGTGQDTGRSVTLAFQDYAYWSGGFAGTATFGEGADAVTLTSDGSTDGFIARVSPEGEIDWVQKVGGAESAIVYGSAWATSPSAGYLIIAGTFSGVALVGDVPLQSRGQDDAFVARLALSDGDVEWAAQVGGNQGDQGRAVAFSDEGAIILAGWFSGQTVVGTDVLTSAGLTDVLVAGFSPSGDALWGRRGGGADFDVATGVYATPRYDIVTRGGDVGTPPILVTGYIDGPSTFSGASGGPVVVTPQERDGFVAAYVPDFTTTSGPELVSVSVLGGPNNDSAQGVAATPSFNAPPPAAGEGGNLYIVTAGTFSGTATLFGETVQSAGSNDLFIAKQATCPSLYCFNNTAAGGSPEASELSLSVAPHPASGASTLTLSLRDPAEVRVEVYDARGRRVALVADGLHASGDHPFAWPLLSPGTYLVRAATPDGAASRSVVVAR